MARAASAARSYLLARLRPYAAPVREEARDFGRAPVGLVPEVCAQLRALSAADLRVVLAAFHAHPAEATGSLVADAAPRSKQPVRFLDLVVALLVGGSRLGTTAQLLDAAEAVAAHAPPDCAVAVDFWTVFAERVGRLSASNELDAEAMPRVLRLCAEWEARAGSTAALGKHRGGRLREGSMP